MKTAGVFHYAKDSGRFGRKSNGKVRFGSLRPKYCGRTGPTEFAVPFLTNRFIALLFTYIM